MQASRSAGAKREHYPKVFYEELASQPEQVIRRLCAYLDLPRFDQVPHHHERAVQRLEDHRERVALDGSVLVSRELRRFEVVTGSQLRELAFCAAPEL